MVGGTFRVGDPMIALVPALAISIVEFANADTVSVCAVVRPPVLDPRELAAWKILGFVMMDGTTSFTREDLFRYGGQGGSPPRIWTTADTMIISVDAPAGEDGLDVASDILVSILTKPELSEASVLRWRNPASLSQSAWDLATQPQVFDLNLVTPRIVRETYSRFVRPDNTRFAIAGKIDRATAREVLETRLQEWIKAPRKQSPTDSASRWRTRSELPVTTTEIRAETSAQTPVEFATRLLATVALGGGKSSVMFQELREKMGIAYQTQAILSPSRAGWQTSLLTFTTASTTEEGLGEKIRETLKGVVTTWSDSDLARWNSIAMASLEGNFALSPIWITSSAVMGPRTSDDAILSALSNGVLTRENIIAALPAVRLDLVQTDALKVLTGQTFMIRGVPAEP